MKYPQNEPGSLQEFREFLGVRTTFWGLLAMFSVFFPLSNIFFQALPLDQKGVNSGVFNILSPTLMTVIATVVTLVAVLSIFITRGTYRGRGKRNARHKALVSIMISIATLIAYIIIYKIYSSHFSSVISLGSYHMRKLFFEAPLMLAYTTFFSHVTQTLALIAMTKFHKDNCEYCEER